MGQKKRRNQLRKPAAPVGSGERPSLSASLREIAAPWLDRMTSESTLPEVQVVFQVAVLLWNLSRQPDDATSSKLLGEIKQAVCNDLLPQVPTSDVRALVREMHDIARDRFGHDRRRIVGIEVEPRPGGFHLRAAGIAIETSGTTGT